MNLPALVIWGVVVHGLTQIVTVSLIFQPLRDGLVDASAVVEDVLAGAAGRAARRALRFLAKLISCPMCFGFWVGAGLSLAGLGPLAGLVGWPAVVRAVGDGAAASAVAWAAHTILVRLGALEL